MSPDHPSTLDAAIPLWIPQAMRLATRLTGSPHDAEDLVQTTLLKAARSAHTFRGEASPKTWLFQILINTFRDRPTPPRHLKLADDASPFPLSSPLSSPSDQAETAELTQAVDAALLTLPPRQREALLLSREGLSSPEIATALGSDTTPENARKLIQLARAHLRILLAPHLPPHLSRGLAQEAK